MEYLMTYGWAILVIAVVLGALYSLGLFNQAALAPRAQPGACQIFRPNGAGTNQYISLEGTCTNELPQYVGVFNGQSSVITIPSSGTLNMGSTSFTISIWLNLLLITGNTDIMLKGNGPFNCGSPCTGWELRSRAGYILEFTRTANAVPPRLNGGPVPLTNTWYQMVITYNYTTGNAIAYLDGKAIANQPWTGSYGGSYTDNYNLQIGHGTDSYFIGEISNVQIYNASMDANSVQTLYQEGIGGDPISQQNLVGWWPLNGNANDYSGNLNNGQPTNVIYTTQWPAGYTIP